MRSSPFSRFWAVIAVLEIHGQPVGHGKQFLKPGEMMRRVVQIRTLLATMVALVAAVALAGSAGAAPKAIDPGLTVFQSAGCAGCHTLAAAGAAGKVGPSLDKTKPTAALVISRVTNGKGVMPSFKARLKAPQIKAVAAYVSSVAGKKVAAPATTAAKTTAPAATTAAPRPASTPAAAAAGPETLGGDPVAGAAVFTANGCSGCHTMVAAGATGSIGPSLDARKPSQGTIKATIQSGAVAGGAQMPALNMSATDLANIAAYVYKSTH